VAEMRRATQKPTYYEHSDCRTRPKLATIFSPPSAHFHNPPFSDIILRSPTMIKPSLARVHITFSLSSRTGKPKMEVEVQVLCKELAQSFSRPQQEAPSWKSRDRAFIITLEVEISRTGCCEQIESSEKMEGPAHISRRRTCSKTRTLVHQFWKY
jgi:hypothetical protein